jgi:hypothetical protein
MITFFGLSGLLLIPGNVEVFLKSTNNCGNMGLNGVFLDIYNKRNLCYLSLITSLPSYLYNYTNYSILFVAFSFYLYFSCIKEWKNTIEHHYFKC